MTPAPTPEKTYELYSLKVRFGDPPRTTCRPATLKRLKALPGAEDPALIYLGLLKDRKTAVFLVDGAAEVQGDGKCLPSASELPDAADEARRHRLHRHPGEDGVTPPSTSSTW